MPTPLRSVSITDAEDDRLTVDTLIGVDESGNESDAGDGLCVVVAVRAARTTEVGLVRALIQAGLQPFKHKSASFGYGARLADSERRDRVQQFLAAIESLPITWTAIVCREEYQTAVRAAAAVMAAKKAVTRDVPHGYDGDRAAILHDGKVLNPNYKNAVRQKVAKEFDTGFQHAFHPVYLAFVNEADLTYPESIAADFIGGYLRSRLLDGSTSDQLNEPVLEFDDSWTHSLDTAAPLYYLDSFQPIRGERARSRAAAWIRGESIPPDADPTDVDVYERIIQQVDDETVYAYLSDEL
jgi:hypothetical protein